ncbi:nucleotide exchange factor GrpE [Buchnera aphidicola]|uniref:Protein GrpE n=1 Tax=Buchnera aphidicola (Stegophylla sp.) TaxID=2315800 RepID=A0A4D6YB67_9GAMM|nr:nucleotide exchange factor GrpE [Buchnera aphidicola (Stegophylla sp.)]QCI26342.1 nucleotide exchange factor GrpE [Buchnera aphidicola (Stegophylla sp.)]
MITKEIDNIKSLIYKQEKKLVDLKILSKKKIQIALKRSQEDIKNAYKYCLSKYIISILSDIDNLEKTIELSIKEKKFFSFISYQLKKILKSFLDLFKIYNINIINEINIPFDPNIHQAISISSSCDIQPNYVIMIMQKGYKLHDRLLRPAMVVVSQPS